MVGYADFCHLVQKGAVVTLTISGVTGLNGTKIVHNVDKFILFNLLKSELQYCNPFWNDSVTMCHCSFGYKVMASLAVINEFEVELLHYARTVAIAKLPALFLNVLTSLL